MAALVVRSGGLPRWPGRAAHRRAADAGRRDHLAGVHDRRPRLSTTARRCSTALPPATYDVLRARHPQRHHRHPEDQGRATTTRAATASSWPASASTGPTPASRTAWRTRWATTRCGSRSTAQATGAEDHVGLPDQRKFSPLFPSYRSTLANLLGLRFIATGAPIETIDRTLKPGDLPLVARTSDGYIYENPAAIDRVLFATAGAGRRFRPHAAGRHLARRRPAPTVLLEQRRRRRRATPARPASVRIASYRNTEVVAGGRQPRRRLGRAQRPLAPLVVRRGRRPAGRDPARQRAVPRRRRAAGPAQVRSRSALSGRRASSPAQRR